MGSSPKFSSRERFSAAAASLDWVLTIVLLLLLFGSSRIIRFDYDDGFGEKDWEAPCEEIYVVKEGETLQSVMEKCGDPFVVERNPHIHDPDDLFPGLLIRVTPSRPM